MGRCLTRQLETGGMALNRIQHIKPVIRALNALHRETCVEASVLLVAGFMYLHDRQIYSSNFLKMEQIDTNKTPEVVAIKKEKDSMAKWSFALGLASVFFAWIGIVPWLAVIFGVWALFRTKESGTGRWMAVSGLVLGILYAFANAHMYGHFLSQKTVNFSQTQNNFNAQSTTTSPVDAKTATVTPGTIPSSAEQKNTTQLKNTISKNENVPASRTWSALTSFPGSGIANTQAFHVTGGKVRIKAIVIPDVKEHSGLSVFRLECDACGKYYLGHELFINTHGVTEDDSIIYSDLPDGDYFISVNSSEDSIWNIFVEDYK